MIESLTVTSAANYAIFLLLALITLVSAIMVITREEIVHCALYLVLTFFSVAGLYIQLKAQFLAAVQVLVYAGGIMVLYLFVILLVNKRVSETPQPQTAFKFLAAIIGITLFLEFIYIFIGAGKKIASLISGTLFDGTVENLGVMLYTKYIFQFELISIVLLAAMVGAIVLSRKS
ncbi:MAG: NADH-quinone oxidoreductase subunit J [Candidatus Schekmanbacteria bacterium]|nr:MAG: NADH-quinone oxidoreductase subunit J [Candidatus Schekmanbacteria bacterium]